MTYDSFVRDRLPPPELLPEFRFDLPGLQYPERLNCAAELLKGGTPDALSLNVTTAPAVMGEVGELVGVFATGGFAVGRPNRLISE